MAEPKTIPTGKSVDQFFDSVEPERKREEAKVLDALFRKVTGEEPRLWGPSIIGYGEYRTTYESGRQVHWLRTGFSPRKAKHSLYLMGGYCDSVTGDDHAKDLEQLGKHSRGKSCLYINKLADIDVDVLERMIRRDYEEMRRRYPK
ncbi:DUF1801 domain-containing protein [Paraurantiacibacter namhicola]|uniref:YdhG-like domain-containing protein n=1 Tax=Paraurantiacibacter namhicola TaxID=645517 RepID=A0A1C7D8A6_9SPHN|nr:DUF1801 domain-containing protein [Paraurantiacibacter namhicola]ANU07677.1 hypothetical protein A6F65_01371 [Paraurantiacibacter namhicola]